MRLCAVVLAVAAGFAAVAAADEPVTVAYYYRVRWGFQQEFERLYMKNHYPVMAAQKEQGRIAGLHIYRPTFHGDGRADWTFLVVIAFKDWAAFHADPGEDAIARKLFADFDRYKQEEQRRFELVEAHWDVPLTPVPPPR